MKILFATITLALGASVATASSTFHSNLRNGRELQVIFPTYNQQCRDDAGPPFRDDSETFNGGRYHDGKPAFAVGDCPDPLKGACATKSKTAAFLEGPVDCGGRGWFCRILEDEPNWPNIILNTDVNFGYCNTTEGFEDAGYDRAGHCHGSDSDETFYWWVRDHWHRQYNGRLRCCCGWDDLVKEGKIVNRCDHRRLVTPTENLDECRDANEEGSTPYNGGCDQSSPPALNEPIPEDDSMCWEVQKFGEPGDSSNDGGGGNNDNNDEEENDDEDRPSQDENEDEDVDRPSQDENEEDNENDEGEQSREDEDQEEDEDDNEEEQQSQEEEQPSEDQEEENEDENEEENQSQEEEQPSEDQEEENEDENEEENQSQEEEQPSEDQEEENEEEDKEENQSQEEEQPSEEQEEENEDEDEEDNQSPDEEQPSEDQEEENEDEDENEEDNQSPDEDEYEEEDEYEDEEQYSQDEDEERPSEDDNEDDESENDEEEDNETPSGDEDEDNEQSPEDEDNDNDNDEEEDNVFDRPSQDEEDNGENEDNEEGDNDNNESECQDDASFLFRGREGKDCQWVADKLEKKPRFCNRGSNGKKVNVWCPVTCGGC